MARGERPLDHGESPLLRFAADLRWLRKQAGGPAYRELGRRAHYSAAALSDAASGRKLPSLAVTLAYVSACDGDVVAWERRWHELATELAATETAVRPRDHDTERAPYVGLAVFQPEDADRFFGRDRLVAHLIAQVTRQRFVTVIGPSGSGKSSLLRAGLLHHARTRGLNGAPGGPTLVLTPGPHPLEELAARLAVLVDRTATSVHTALRADPRGLHLTGLQALARQSPEVDLLVVVDQFEEVFTLCRSTAERARFLELLWTAARAGNSRTRVVVGIRADFYAHCVHHPELVEALRDTQVLIGPMSTDELRNAITQPAIQARYRVDTALVSQIIADATGQPGVLPLVSHALLETWRRRQGVTLTLAGYHAAGGIEQSIARTAESVYGTLSPDQQQWAQQLFVRLVALGEGTADTRRGLDRSELDLDTPDAAAVLEQLVRARLVTRDRDSIEITHETLVRCWPRLHGWLTDDREGLRIHRQLTEAANSWHELHRDSGALYRGVRLAQAGQWATSGGDRALAARERQFLAASLAAQAREQALTRRRTRRLRQLLALLTALLVITTSATGYALRARHATAEQRNLAITQKVLVQANALRATNPALSLQLNLAAYRRTPNLAEARTGLLNTLAAPYATRMRMVSAMRYVTALAFSPDGRTLTAAGDAGKVWSWDVTNARRPRQVVPLAHGSQVNSMAYSPDGHILAIVGGDNTIRLWDVSNPARPRQYTSLKTSSGAIYGNVTFSPDGRTLAAGGGDGTGHGVVRMWDLTGPDRPRELMHRTGDPDLVYGVDFSPDGRTLATAGTDRTTTRHTVRLWDTTHPDRPGRPVVLTTAQNDFIRLLRFSPDGRTLATGLSAGDAMRLWDVTNPRQPREPTLLTGSVGTVMDAAFSPDGHTFATAGTDRTVRLWDITDSRHPHALTTLTGYSSGVNALAFSPDRHTLAVGGADHIVRLEDVTAYTFPARAHGAVTSVGFSADGRLLATGHANGTVGLWDATDPQPPLHRATLAPDNNQEYLVSLVFSPDGHTLATYSQKGPSSTGTVRLWDTTPSHRPGGQAPIFTTSAGDDPSAAPYPLAFSPDGHTLATRADERAMRLWDVTDPHHPQAIATLTGFTIRVDSAAFSPDSRILATESDDRGVRLWDITDRHRPRVLTVLPRPSAGQIHSIAFSPDGRVLATGAEDDTVRLWEVSDPHRPRALTTLTTTSTPHSLDFSADGHTLAAGAADGTVRLWDLTKTRHPQPTTTLLTTVGIGSIAFNPANGILATAGAERVGADRSYDYGKRTRDVSPPGYANSPGPRSPALNGTNTSPASPTNHPAHSDERVSGQGRDHSLPAG